MIPTNYYTQLALDVEVVMSCVYYEVTASGKFCMQAQHHIAISLPARCYLVADFCDEPQTQAEPVRAVHLSGICSRNRSQTDVLEQSRYC